jgi:hypothetical protein
MSAIVARARDFMRGIWDLQPDHPFFELPKSVQDIITATILSPPQSRPTVADIRVVLQDFHVQLRKARLAAEAAEVAALEAMYKQCVAAEGGAGVGGDMGGALAVLPAEQQHQGLGQTASAAPTAPIGVLAPLPLDLAALEEGGGLELERGGGVGEGMGGDVPGALAVVPAEQQPQGLGQAAPAAHVPDGMLPSLPLDLAALEQGGDLAGPHLPSPATTISSVGHGAWSVKDELGGAGPASPVGSLGVNIMDTPPGTPRAGAAGDGFAGLRELLHWLAAARRQGSLMGRALAAVLEWVEGAAAAGHHRAEGVQGGGVASAAGQSPPLARRAKMPKLFGVAWERLGLVRGLELAAALCGVPARFLTDRFTLTAGGRGPQSGGRDDGARGVDAGPVLTAATLSSASSDALSSAQGPSASPPDRKGSGGGDAGGELGGDVEGRGQRATGMFSRAWQAVKHAFGRLFGRSSGEPDDELDAMEAGQASACRMGSEEGGPVVGCFGRLVACFRRRR